MRTITYTYVFGDNGLQLVGSNGIILKSGPCEQAVSLRWAIRRLSRREDCGCGRGDYCLEASDETSCFVNYHWLAWRLGWWGEGA